MKNRSTKQLLIFFSLFLVILIGLHFVAFKFISDAGTTASTLQSQVNGLRAQVAEFSKYSSDDLKNMASKVQTLFIQKEGLVPFINGVEAAARSQGLAVNVNNVDVENHSDNASDNKEVVSLDLETSGSWQNSMRFINYLEHLPYKVELKSVSLTLGGANAGIVQTDASSTQARAGGASWQTVIRLAALKLKN